MLPTPSSMKAVYFIYVLSLGYLIRFSQACMTCCKCGSFLPDDPFHFANETTELICALDKPSQLINATDLYILFNNSEIDSSFLTIVNETAVSFTKVVTKEDDGLYTCRIRGLSGMSGVVGTTYLQVDDPLEPITDIQCTWYNWKDGLDCNWTLPYRYIQYIQVKLLWCNTGFNCGYNGAQNYCPNMENKTKCVWDPKRVALDAGPWYFKLTVINTRHNNETVTGEWISKNVNDNVKPKAVEFLNVTFTNESTCVRLNWAYDRYISKSREKHYRIQYSLVSEPSHNEMWTVDENVTICDLRPYTVYTFTIGVHPDRAGVKGYWSDLVTKEFKTDQDVPNQSPVIVGYKLSSDLKYIEGVNLIRTYTVYWKSLLEMDRNGIITGYMVAYTDLSPGNHHSDSFFQNGTVTSVNIRLHQNKLYNISITAATIKGCSPHQSSLIINTTGITPASVMVERNSSQYNVSWTVSGPVDSSTSFSVVYCTAISSQQQCSGELEKVTVPSSQTRHKILSLMSDTMYMFGVSVVRAEVISAAKFESCIYVATERPSQPLFFVDDSVGENSLRVEWDPITCNNKEPFVTSFTIAWCKTNDKQEDQCAGQNHSAVIPSSSSRLFIIRNLDKGVRYGVFMYSSSTSQTSLRTEMKYGTPTNNDISTGAIVGIVIGAIFLCALVIAGIIWCYRTTSYKVSALKKPYAIDVPQIEKDSSPTSSTRSSTNNSKQALLPENHFMDMDCKKNPGQNHSGKSNGYTTKRQLSRDSGKGGSLSTEPDSPDRLDPVPEDETTHYTEVVDYTSKIRDTSGAETRNPSSVNNPYSVVHTSEPDSQESEEQDMSQSHRQGRTVSDSEVHVNPVEVTVMFVGAPNPRRESAGSDDGYTNHNQICESDSELIHPGTADTVGPENEAVPPQTSIPHCPLSDHLTNEPGLHPSLKTAKETSAGVDNSAYMDTSDGYKTHDTIGSGSPNNTQSNCLPLVSDNSTSTSDPGSYCTVQTAATT